MSIGVCPFPAGWIFIPFDLQQPAESPSPTEDKEDTSCLRVKDVGDVRGRRTLPGARRSRGRADSERAARRDEDSAAPSPPGTLPADVEHLRLPFPAAGGRRPEAPRGGAQAVRCLRSLARSPPRRAAPQPSAAATATPCAERRSGAQPPRDGGAVPVPVPVSVPVLGGGGGAAADPASHQRRARAGGGAGRGPAALRGRRAGMLRRRGAESGAGGGGAGRAPQRIAAGRRGPVPGHRVVLPLQGPGGGPLHEPPALRCHGKARRGTARGIPSLYPSLGCWVYSYFSSPAACFSHYRLLRCVKLHQKRLQVMLKSWPKAAGRQARRGAIYWVMGSRPN